MITRPGAPEDDLWAYAFHALVGDVSHRTYQPVRREIGARLAARHDPETPQISSADAGKRTSALEPLVMDLVMKSLLPSAQQVTSRTKLPPLTCGKTTV